MKTTHQRIGALVLAAAVSAALLCPPALAAGALSPVCDESYYATLDYYGGLINSSVVKSYQTNGNTALTDYGTYDEIINLTDDRAPTTQDGAVTFELGEDGPERFYFEGKTEQPFRDLPWTLTLSYKLNGAPALAEDLAGKTGLVEIDLDVLPNPAAPAYSRNNLVLTAATAFNADDILSLEAPGAEVQLIGNLRTVLFMVMPGEEQHFAIRVGSNDFSFPGMVLLAVPATLGQLDQIADLREAKEKVEDSYDAINDSLDVILDTLDGMSGSLNTTANGLDRLNDARRTISGGKDHVYQNADAALADLDTLSDALEPAAGHLASASQALTETTQTLTDLTENAVALKPELESTRKIIQQIQSDTSSLRELIDSVESYNKSASVIASNLEDDFYYMSDQMDDLQSSLSALENTLSRISGMSTVDEITIEGMSIYELRESAAATANAHQLYLQNVPEAMRDQVTFQVFLTSPAVGLDAATAAQMNVLWNQMESDPDFWDKLDQADTVNEVIDGVNGKISEVNRLLKGIAKPTSQVVGDLQNLCYWLGEDGLSGDLEELSKLAASLLKDGKAHEGAASSLLNSLDELGDLAGRVTKNADTALDLLQSLDGTLNTYEPQAQQALSDAQALTDAATSGLRNSTAFLRSAESLLKDSGGDLDEGTRQALSGLTDALRRSTTGLSQTDTIRAAKATITGLIEDEWNSHTGGDNNLLLMDADAAPISLTSSKNASPNSIQFIMRTQEIKVPETASEDATSVDTASQGTVWSRIAAMFRDFWHMLTGVFRRG